MRILIISSFLIGLAASAIQVSLLEDFSLILARQAPGTPQFECHSNCGNAIAGGRSATHCDNSTWIDLYEACLGCALTFDIWKLYGQGVGSAGRACSLEANPSPSSAGSAVTSGTSVPATGTTSTASISTTPAPSSDPSITPAPSTETDAPGPAATTSTTVTGVASQRWALEPMLGLLILGAFAFAI